MVITDRHCSTLKTIQGLRQLVISDILLVMVSSAHGVDQHMITVHCYILEEKSASSQSDIPAVILDNFFKTKHTKKE